MVHVFCWPRSTEYQAEHNLTINLPNTVNNQTNNSGIDLQIWCGRRAFRSLIGRLKQKHKKPKGLFHFKNAEDRGFFSTLIYEFINDVVI